MMKSLLSTCLISVTLAACTQIPPEAYYEHGQPESLLDVSSEVVNLPIQSETALDELSSWINKDQPSRAELYCADSGPQCTAAQQVLDLYGVPTTQMPSSDNMVSLVYERVLARDCENRYIDNSVNPYNFNHPTFGCSVAVNMVQAVSDKHQFVRPNLLDIPDARKGVQAYQNYLTRRDVKQDSYSIKNSLLQESKIDE